MTIIPQVIVPAKYQSRSRETRRSDVGEWRVTRRTPQTSGMPVDVDGVKQVPIMYVTAAPGALPHDRRSQRGRLRRYGGRAAATSRRLGSLKHGQRLHRRR